MVRHYSLCNGSGMHHMAQSMAEADRRLGHDSAVVNIDVATAPEWADAPLADVHVIHTHFPDAIRRQIKRPHAIVFVAHGTPEHVLDTSIEQANAIGYGPSDGWMSLRHQLNHADAVVTFWERHQAIYQSLVPRERQIHLVPMGIDTAFWAGGTDHGHYAGEPAVWMSENQHRMKWALDILIAWPWVTRQLPDARLHANYIPYDLHRFFIDLANSNGGAYRSYLSGKQFPHEQLRNIWKSVDFVLNPVRYGDHNCLGLQAAAAGVPVISYRGNPYASFWLTEGDQRQMATELVEILAGRTPPRREIACVPTLEEMGQAMDAVYTHVLARALPPGYVAPPRAPKAPATMPSHVKAHFDQIMARRAAPPKKKKPPMKRGRR